MSGFLCSMVGATFSVAAAAEVIRLKKSVIAYGNAQVDTAQSKFGGSSALFDGTGDYLFSPSNSDFGFGTGDFTLEGWFRFVNFTNGPALFDLRAAGGTEVKPLIYCGADGVLYYYVNGAARITGSALSANTWYHITVSRASGSTKMFVNGTQVGSTYSDSNNYGTTVVSIGIASWNTAFNALNGHADEIRISNTARYTANFTAPTTAFVNDDNTVLLIHADGTDGSTFFEDDNGMTPFSTRTARTLTAQGNAQVDTAQFKYGSSALLCDGTGDYVVSPAGTQWEFGTSSFTIEYWIRFNAINTLYVPICLRTAGGNIFNGEWWCEITAAENKMYWGFKNQAGTQYYVNLALAGTAFATNQWYHIALVNNAGTAQMYVNGTATGATTALSGSFGGSGTNLNIGAYQGLYSVNGWIDEVRISNTARYTANFTPSTAPFNSDANTVLLMHMEGTDASTIFVDDIYGVRRQQGIIANVNAQVDTAQSKFGGSSLYVNSYTAGNGSSLYIPDIKDQVKWGTTGKSFTAECWARWTQFPNPGLAATGEGSFPLINLCRNTQGYIKWCFGVNDQGYLGTDYTLSWSSYGGKTQYDTSEALSLNTWYHIAFVWDEVADSIRIYRDGVLKLNITNPLEGYTLNWVGEGAGAAPFGVFIGAHYWGQEVHIDELRFSDSARYTTSNFTAPTQPFVNDANTLLLIHGDGTDASTVFRDDNGASQRVAKHISYYGNAQIDTAQSKFGGSSALFDGTGDYLRVYELPTIGTGDFTVEFWFRPNYSSSPNMLLWDNRGSVSTSTGANLINFIGASPVVNYWVAGSYRITGTTVLSSGTWYHIAVSRSGTSTKLFINGTQDGSTYTDSNSYVSNPGQYIGIAYDGGASTNGHIDEFRVSNSARYTANFTAPTAQFQNDANTVLLLHFNGADAATTFVDDNGGRAQNGIQSLGGANTSTTQSKFGGTSLQLDGTDNKLVIPWSNDLALTGTSWTVEYWVYISSHTGSYTGNISMWEDGGSGDGSVYYFSTNMYSSSQKMGIQYIYGISSNSGPIQFGSTLATGAWQHHAWVRNGNTLTAYLNGTSQGTHDMTGRNFYGPGLNLSSGPGTTLKIGGINAGGYQNGYMDEIRISNTARYTANFTAPTAPFQNDANTLLLIHCDGANASTVFFDDNGRDTTPTA